MKKIFLILLLISYITTGVAAAKRDALCHKYLRLHILANSNSSYDQSIKLKVKNYFFDLYKDDFNKINSKEEMLSFLNKKNKEITNNINGFLNKNGINYDCSLRIEKTKYKQSNFKNINLPAGNYDSVKIILGKGKGNNVFFLMFPNLSLKENVTVKTTDENKITYKSKILELLSLQ